MRLTRYVQTTQNNKFAISLQHLKEADFLHADKRESFLQIDIIIVDKDAQALLKFTKQQFCSVFTMPQKKKLEVKLFFVCR